MKLTEYKEELLKYNIHFFDQDEKSWEEAIKNNMFYNPVEEKIWYENGHKYTKITVFWNENYADNQKNRETNFKDDKQDGLDVKWNEHGKKEWEDNYKDGELHGLSIDWNEDGQKVSEANFKDGKHHGLATSWNEDGKKDYEEKCNNGEIISQTYFENGEIVETLQATASEPLSPGWSNLRHYTDDIWRYYSRGV